MGGALHEYSWGKGLIKISNNSQTDLPHYAGWLNPFICAITDPVRTRNQTTAVTVTSVKHWNNRYYLLYVRTPRFPNWGETC